MNELPLRPFYGRLPIWAYFEAIEKLAKAPHEIQTIEIMKIVSMDCADLLFFLFFVFVLGGKEGGDFQNSTDFRISWELFISV